MLITQNKLVACTPFLKLNVETKKTGGLHMVDQKVKLQELSVVMFCEYDKNIGPGTKVYVRGDAITQNWAKEIFTQDGVEFILVPLGAIQYISAPEASWQSGC